MEEWYHILFKRVTELFCFVLIILPFYGFSQQDPVYTQYMNNLLTIQPAYAGISGDLNVTGISRAQWIGFPGAPNTNTLTISSPISKYNIGLGLSIVNDKWGPIKQNGIYVDYAFRVRLRQDQYLSFGLKGGFNIYQAYFTDLALIYQNDMIFAYDINIKFLPNLGVGCSFLPLAFLSWENTGDWMGDPVDQWGNKTHGAVGAAAAKVLTT